MHRVGWAANIPPAPGQTRIDLRAPLSLQHAFWFPLQVPAARRDVLIGGLLLLVPGLGWVLNMGHRLRIVHRMQHGEESWPAWSGGAAAWWDLFKHGTITTIGIAVYHLPAAPFIWWAQKSGSLAIWAAAAAVWLACSFIVPGFMTFYARTYDVREIMDPRRAMRRAFQGGRPYLHAWGITVCAGLLSWLGLLGFGVGFLFTSVWFWQVAAFSFATVFSQQHRLIADDEVPEDAQVSAATS